MPADLVILQLRIHSYHGEQPRTEPCIVAECCVIDSRQCYDASGLRPSRKWTCTVYCIASSLRRPTQRRLDLVAQHCWWSRGTYAGAWRGAHADIVLVGLLHRFHGRQLHCASWLGSQLYDPIGPCIDRERHIMYHRHSFRQRIESLFAIYAAHLAIYAAHHRVFKGQA